MPVTQAQKDALASNVTFCCELWRLTATDGTVAAYANHTQNVTFDSVTYKAEPAEPTRSTRKLGLDPDTAEMSGLLDSVMTEADIIGGRWRKARIQKEILVDYRDVSLGSIWKQLGEAGEFTIRNGLWTCEFRSLAHLLGQEIGELTSPIDRNRRPEDLGVSMVPFTHARTVTAFADRRNFTVGGVAQVNNYFKYGRAEWTSGANNGLKMEVKSNVGNVIELQLPMRSNIQIGDNVTLIAGYDGTREQARDKFGAGIAFNGEPDLPGLKSVLSYPE